MRLAFRILIGLLPAFATTASFQLARAADPEWPDCGDYVVAGKIASCPAPDRCAFETQPGTLSARKFPVRGGFGALSWFARQELWLELEAEVRGDGLLRVKADSVPRIIAPFEATQTFRRVRSSECDAR